MNVNDRAEASGHGGGEQFPPEDLCQSFAKRVHDCGRHGFKVFHDPQNLTIRPEEGVEDRPGWFPYLRGKTTKTDFQTIYALWANLETDSIERGPKLAGIDGHLRRIREQQAQTARQLAEIDTLLDRQMARHERAQLICRHDMLQRTVPKVAQDEAWYIGEREAVEATSEAAWWAVVHAVWDVAGVIRDYEAFSP